MHLKMLATKLWFSSCLRLSKHLVPYLWGVFCEDFWEHWPCYNDTSLYLTFPQPIHPASHNFHNPVLEGWGMLWFHLIVTHCPAEIMCYHVVHYIYTINSLPNPHNRHLIASVQDDAKKCSGPHQNFEKKKKKILHYVAAGLRLRFPPARQSEGIAMGGPHRFLDKG